MNNTFGANLESARDPGHGDAFIRFTNGPRGARPPPDAPQLQACTWGRGLSVVA